MLEPLPPSPITSHLFSSSEIIVALVTTTLVSAIISLDELLILSCWMIINTNLLSHEEWCQCRLYQHFVGRQNVTWLAPPPP